MPWIRNGGIQTNHYKSVIRVTPACPCFYPILFGNDEGEHPSCIEYKTDSELHQMVTPSSSYDRRTSINGVYFQRRDISNICEPGTFEVSFRWDSGHSPYPRISNMTIYVFGVKVRDNEPMPCACDDDRDKRGYETVARVTIHEDGTHTVEKIGGRGSEDNQEENQPAEEDDIQ